MQKGSGPGLPVEAVHYSTCLCSSTNVDCGHGAECPAPDCSRTVYVYVHYAGSTPSHDTSGTCIPHPDALGSSSTRGVGPHRTPQICAYPRTVSCELRAPDSCGGLDRLELRGTTKSHSGFSAVGRGREQGATARGLAVPANQQMPLCRISRNSESRAEGAGQINLSGLWVIALEVPRGELHRFWPLHSCVSEPKPISMAQPATDLSRSQLLTVSQMYEYSSYNQGCPPVVRWLCPRELDAFGQGKLTWIRR